MITRVGTILVSIMYFTALSGCGQDIVHAKPEKSIRYLASQRMFVADYKDASGNDATTLLNPASVYHSYLDDFPRSQIDSDSKSATILSSAIRIGSSFNRDGILATPDTAIRFPETFIRPASLLYVSMGLLNTAAMGPGDGVRFRVLAIDDSTGVEVVLLSLHMNNNRRPEDRVWRDVLIALDDYAGRKIAVVLETTSGPEDDRRWDYAYWSGLKLLTHESPQDEKSRG